MASVPEIGNGIGVLYEEAEDPRHVEQVLNQLGGFVDNSADGYTSQSARHLRVAMYADGVSDRVEAIAEAVVMQRAELDSVN